MGPQNERRSGVRIGATRESDAGTVPLGVSRWPPHMSLRRFITQAVDFSEFLRFVFTGMLASVGNLVAVWSARRSQSFELSLLVGIVVALAISFTLSKWFAFGSGSWRSGFAEAPRFLTVFSAGCALYWATAVFAGKFVLPHFIPPAVAEGCGVLIGAGAMTVTSYLGHRFFTYRTHQGGHKQSGAAAAVEARRMSSEANGDGR
jgi:putative flippase GtrA